MPHTVLILASGPGIGLHCASLFKTAGYNVVTASRSLKDSLVTTDHLELQVDLARPDTVAPLFEKIRNSGFDHPRVVIYNGAARSLASPQDPLSTITVETINHDNAVNITSALLAAHEAVKGWQAHNDEHKSKPTFIYTGNKQNVMTDPKALTFGMGKTAAAKMMWDCSTGYRHLGYRFYFTDQRKADGTPAREQMDPKARAELYLELAEDINPRPWHYTFVKDAGYVDFRSIDRAWDVDIE